MALPRAKLGVSLFRHPCRKPLPPGERQCMLGWLCICAIVVVCCRCVLHRLCPTTCMRPCKALGHTRPATVPGLSVGLPPSPRLGLRPKPHFQKLYRFIDSLKPVSPDTDFLLLIIPGYRPLPTLPQSPANHKPFKKSDFAVPHGCFVLLSFSHRLTPTVPQSPANRKPLKRSEFAVPHGHLVLAEPVTNPLTVFGKIALAPVSVCRCSRPQYRAGFILVADTPVTVAYALLVKIAKPLLRFVEVVRTAARCVTSTEFRHEYRQSL